MQLNVLLDSEFYYWFLIPIIIAVFVFTKSILILVTKRNLINWIFTLLTISIIIFSGYILGVIFFMEVLPIYIPQIGIGLALIIYSIQHLINIIPKS